MGTQKQRKNIALITGGSGFLGEKIAETLALKGDKVRVYDVLKFQGQNKNIEFHRGDVLDKNRLEKIAGDAKIIYHLAALVPLTKSGKRFWEVNVGGTQNIIDIAKKNSIRLVYVSSSAIYGMPKCPINSQTPARPIEAYGKSKLAAENLVKKYIEAGGSAVIIRPRTILGAKRLGIFDILFEWISENRNIYIIGKGQNRFQFIHIDDLVSAIVKAANLKICGAFNIGTDKFGTLRGDLEAFIKKAGSGSRVISINPLIAIPALRILDFLKLSPLAPWHYLTYHKPFYFDIRKEIRDLSFKPKYSNLQMLISSYKSYLKSRNRANKPGSVHNSSLKQGILTLLKAIS